ncbi:MAG: hypothetical protein JNK67_22640 [Alphaproteobacteria bacterium]|nr:hypothetical protein [Alphaproteobacteria bacterium]
MPAAPTPLPLDAFRLQAGTLGLRLDDAEIVELHQAYTQFLALLARVHAHPGAAGDDWPESLPEAWER